MTRVVVHLSCCVLHRHLHGLPVDEAGVRPSTCLPCVGNQRFCVYQRASAVSRRWAEWGVWEPLSRDVVRAGQGAEGAPRPSHPVNVAAVGGHTAPSSRCTRSTSDRRRRCTTPMTGKSDDRVAGVAGVASGCAG